MKSFEIKSFRGGISDFEDKGITGAFKLGLALDIRKKVDSLSCQQALVDEGAGIIVDLIYFIVPASDGNSYGLGSTGKIYKRTSAGVWSVVYTDVDGAIKGAAEWFSSAGKSYLYWATNTKLHRKELPGLSNWTDVDADPGWPKTDLTSATWHTMKQAGGALMICNDRYLAMVGYDSSYTNNAVDLILGNVTKTLIEAGNSVLAGTVKKDNSEKGNLFLWEQTALSWIKKKDIPSKGINAIIESEVLLMQVGTKGGLYFSDMVNVLPVTSFPGGGQVNPDAADVDEGLALFGVFGNGAGNIGVYGYGRKIKNGQVALNLEYPLACDEIGSVKKVGGDILISYKSGATYGVKKVDATTKAQADYQGLDLKAPSDLPQKPVVWGLVKLILASLPASCAIECWYRVNKNGSFLQAKMEGNVAQFTTAGEQEAIFQIGAEGKIFEVELKLIPSGNNSPEVYKIEIFFE